VSVPRCVRRVHEGTAFDLVTALGDENVADLTVVTSGGWAAASSACR